MRRYEAIGVPARALVAAMGMLALALAVVLPAEASAASGSFGRATPESQGIASAAIEKYVKACEKELKGIHSFVLVRHGSIVAEGYWAPFSADRTHLLYSLSKSFTSTAAGFLVDDGKLDLDERLVDIFPEYAPETPDRNMAEMRVRDLLTMNAGQDKQATGKDPSGDWVKAFLNNKTERRPGSGFKYDSCVTHVLAAIVEKKTGMKLMDFLQERLFSKLGIEGAWSNTSPTGVACGGWGMNMKTRDIAKFGQLYLNEGEWNGERLLSREWVRLATSHQTRTDRKGEGDWNQGYGFQFWRCRHNCYRAAGAYGQFVVVMPDKDAGIAMTAGLSDMAKELDLVWKHLLPAMQDGPLPENPAAQAALEKRCRGLAFRPVAGKRDGAEGGLGVKFYLSGKQRRFSFRDVTLSKKGEGWEISLESECGPQKFPVGFGKWEFGEMSVDKRKYEILGALPGVQPTAASGAWTEPDTFQAKVFMVNTPAWFMFTFKFNADGTLGFKSKFWGSDGSEADLSGSPAAPHTSEIL